MAEQTHQTHAEIVKRLKRLDGHLQNVIEMIEKGRPCVEIVQQLHAVERAVTAAKKVLIHDHIDHCLEVAAGPISQKDRGPIDEFKAITKYL